MAIRKLLVKAGHHDRRYAPASYLLGEGAPAQGRLTRADTGEAIPCQVWDGVLHFIVDQLGAADERPYTFDPDAPAVPSPGVKLRHRKHVKMIKIKVDARKFCTYHFNEKYARPFFHPFLGPKGLQITRNYPVIQDVAGETTDHEHHRSVWVAHGDVNKSDNWGEGENHAWQTHQEITQMIEGAVFGQFQQRLIWADKEHNMLMKETRTVRVYATPSSARLLELTVALTAPVADVVLGDTLEGGICCVRVATSMDANNGGRIENSCGGIGEAETWGKPAHWCDYSGPIKGHPVGIAIFDHPMNLRHPTTWHVRDYGLMTANPFGHSHFKSGWLKNGAHTIRAGATLTFRYRLFIHSHDARLARVADRYQDYVNPPRVEAVD